jgi:hypothetical protein
LVLEVHVLDVHILLHLKGLKLLILLLLLIRVFRHFNITQLLLEEKLEFSIVGQNVNSKLRDSRVVFLRASKA